MKSSSAAPRSRVEGNPVMAGSWEYPPSLLSSTTKIIAAAARGEVFILVDDPKRENEGDLIVLADCVTPAAINFMARYGRGLVCLALDSLCAQRVGITLAPRHNVDVFHTPFAHSIDARHGISTGISAADRAHTIQTAIASSSDSSHFVSPGHIFPLIASAGGVLSRPGHTEAAVDIAKLAGMTPAAVICEVLNDDGSMARLPDLIRFSQEHQVEIGTISDLINHRKKFG